MFSHIFYAFLFAFNVIFDLSKKIQKFLPTKGLS